MNQFDEFRSCLLDHDDGSCRNINFTPLKMADFATMVRRLFSLATDFTGHDSNGKELPFDPDAFVESITLSDSSHGVLKNVAGVFSQLQIFAWLVEGGLSVELTFFPEELISATDPLFALVEFLTELCREIDITEYYVRYENAGWQFGETGPESGVIFTRSRVS
ncbi:MAG: hypothetical protein AB7N71_03180 [Phycisphaerae bacterium]